MDRLIFFLGSLMLLTLACCPPKRKCEHFGHNPGDKAVERGSLHEKT